MFFCSRGPKQINVALHGWCFGTAQKKKPRTGSRPHRCLRRWPVFVPCTPRAASWPSVPRPGAPDRRIGGPTAKKSTGLCRDEHGSQKGGPAGGRQKGDSANCLASTTSTLQAVLESAQRNLEVCHRQGSTPMASFAQEGARFELVSSWLAGVYHWAQSDPLNTSPLQINM